MNPSSRSADFSPPFFARRRALLISALPLFNISAFVFLLSLPAHGLLDRNSDGIDDIWTRHYHNQQLVTIDPAADPDGDGWNNARECAAGTDPNKPDNTPNLLAATPATIAGLHYLDFPTLTGKSYQIQLTDNLLLWQNQGAPYLGNGRPIEDIVQATLADGTTPARLFWRLGITDHDTDGDGLSDWAEKIIDTNPDLPDTDGDLVPDLAELDRPEPTNPLLRDSDRDGIEDNTDPFPLVNANDPDLPGGDPDGRNLAPAISQDLEGFWDFESPSTGIPVLYQDRSGNNRTATASTVTGNFKGIPSRCGRFAPGTLSIPTSTIAGKPAYTISTWIRPNTGTVSQRQQWQAVWTLYDQQGTGPLPQQAPMGQGTVLMVHTLPGTSTEPALEQWIIGKYQQSFHWNDPPYTNGNPRTELIGNFFTRPSGSIDDGRWHHIAIVRSIPAYIQQIYIDGVLVKECPLVEGTVNYDADTRFLFGNIVNGPSGVQMVDGQLDRLRVHSRVLTAADIQGLHRQDIDADGLWDITECTTRKHARALATHPEDPEDPGNPPPPVNLDGFHLSPFYADNAVGDYDEDELSNLAEQTAGTLLHEPDTDGDGMSDGFEVTYGLNPLSPWADAEQTLPEADEDDDGDGLTNLTEYLNNSNPESGNTDGDPFGDALEIAGGGNPRDPTDDGQPPGTDPRSVPFHIYGDYTAWEATVTGKGPKDTRVRRFQMTDPDQPKDQSFDLHPGNSYEFKLRYLRTKADQNIPWYCWEATIDNQTAPAFTLAGKWLVDNSSGLLAEHTHSQGTNNVKAKKPVTLAPSDLDIIVPGTEDDETPTEIAEDKEDDEGGVATVNWDDDNNSEGPGIHGKVDYKNDFADPPGTKNENDLIQLKLHKAAGITARLKYGNTHIKLWKKSDRREEITSESTEFDLSEDRIVHLEGLKLTASGQPVEILMQIRSGSDSTFQSGDSLKIHVATPVILLCGVGPEMSGEEANSVLNVIASDKTILGKLRFDNRKNTAIVKGKNQSGDCLYYSVDSFGSVAATIPDEKNCRPMTTDKEMKMAIGVEGAHVVFGGHSNFGLGPNFKAAGTQTTDDYMNVSNFGIAGIVLWEKDGSSFDNPMHWPDHGGAAFQLRQTDIQGTVQNQWVNLAPSYHFRRFPEDDVTSFTQQPASPPIPAHHFIQQGDTKKSWVTIVGSSGDAPPLRYGSLFMVSCNSGRHFGMTFSRKPFLYTKDVSMSVIDDYKIDIDSPFITYVQIEGVILGKTWDQITSMLNKNRRDKENTPEDLFKVSQ